MRNKVTFLGLAVAAVLVPSLALAAWSTETVDSTAGSGFFSSLAFNPVTGFPAIAYDAPAKGNQTSVKLAEWNGASWTISTALTDRGFNGGVALAFDPSGNPAVTATMGGAKFARRGGSTWSVQTIDSQGSGTVGSLVYFNGSFWAAYYTSKALKLGHLVGSSWTTEVVDTASVMYPSLAFAPDGGPSIAYRYSSTNSLRFAHKSGSTWTIQTVETGPSQGLIGYGVFASLAYDPLTGYPTIAHANAGPIRFARWDGTQWNIELAATGYSCTYESLAYDAAGIAAISYGLAVDGSGNHQVHIARRDGCSDTCWTDQLIDDETPNQVQWRTSLAFAPTGAANISYGVYSPQILRLAQETP